MPLAVGERALEAANDVLEGLKGGEVIGRVVPKP
jgi:hypothetical protein